MKKTILLLLAASLIFFLFACKSSAVSKLDPVAAAETYLNSGNMFYNKADFDRALMDYDQAILLDPTLAEAYNNRGYVHFVKGNKEQAIADFESALKLDPEYTRAKNNLARARK